MASEKIVTESALAALASDAKRAIYDVLPGGSALGNPCTFDTDIAVPLKSLLANITASGGGGTPSTPIPIVGHSELNLVRCGKNFCSSIYVNTATAIYQDCLWVECELKPNTTYTLTFNGTNGNRVYTNGDIFTDAVYKDISGRTFVTITTKPVLDKTDIHQYTSGRGWRVLKNAKNQDNDNSFSDVQLELGSTATAYEPYNGQTITVSFGQTVYGGVYDANRGKVRITHGCYTITGDETWVQQGSLSKYYTQEYLLRDIAKCPPDNDHAVTIVTSIGTFNRPYNILENYPDTMNLAADGRLAINGSLYAGSGTLAGTQVMYELATPIEIDVPELSVDTIVGVNNIVSDCGGDVEVQYRESVAKYVNDHSTTRTDVVGTLTAGQTSITLSSAAITTSSTIEVFTDPEVPYNSLTVTSGQAVLTFDAQANNVSVKVRVT